MGEIECKKFEENLRDLINNSGIKITEAYYILKMATAEVKEIYDNLIYQQHINQLQNIPEEEDTATGSIDLGDMAQNLEIAD